MSAPTESRLVVSERRQQAARSIRFVAMVSIGAIVLGFAMQAVIVALRILDASVLTGAAQWAELVQTVSWAVLVCAGVAIGVSIANARAALAGVLAMLFAPLALAAAKAAQKVVLALMEASETPALLSTETLGVIRAIEYGMLAWVLALLVERRVTLPWPYLAAGAVAGVTFGGAAIWLSLASASSTGTSLTGLALARLTVTEIGFPIGCALLICITQVVAGQSRVVRQVDGQSDAGLP